MIDDHETTEHGEVEEADAHPGVSPEVAANQEPVDLDRMRADAEARVPAPTIGGWPKTFHHVIHGAREFADPNDYALNGGGYAFDTAARAERARTPLEADIAYRKFLDRVHEASEIEPGANRAPGNHIV